MNTKAILGLTAVGAACIYRRFCSKYLQDGGKVEVEKPHHLHTNLIPETSVIVTGCSSNALNGRRSKANPIVSAAHRIFIRLPTLQAKEESHHEEHHDDEGDVFHLREQRFLDFASVVYKGEIYMTPQDFLTSVSQEHARARKYRLEVDEERVKKWIASTPNRGRGSTHFFRDLNDQGLISYVEYLFLLCILTGSSIIEHHRVSFAMEENDESKSGFKIAFNMFDIDGNQKVDIDEFRVLEKILSGGHGEVTYPLENERLKSQTQTTLLVHLFGSRGDSVLTYDRFVKFTENLQTEVLDMEFQMYAKGMNTISEEDFARVLLTYTNLSEASIEEYLNRVRNRIIDSKGVNFKNFKAFFSFLNHMDDFILMMRLYNLTDKPISKTDFRRAVSICSNEDIDRSVIDAVYTIFDVDGDGHLSTEEFISIMKSRLKRGLRTHLVNEDSGWPKFKSCVRHEMRTKRGGM